MVTAHVTTEAALQEEGPGSVRQRIEVETEQITRDAENFAVKSGLRINVYQQPLKSELGAATTAPVRLFTYGERLRFPAKISLPRNYRNAGAFDYQVIWQKTASSPWARPKLQVSRSSPVFPGDGWSFGVLESIAASSKRCTLCGRAAKPR
jgi:hypothetical protein